MDDPCTDTLRKLAPSWTLAGDEQLLSILQNTHQKLLSKCQEANSQLEQMATALNDASISLQNVNNQFMALSSSQFIESRVYDDDDLPSEAPAVKEPPKPELPDELTSLKHSISVLESTHEIITILQDSDTDSDTDDDMPDRLVLKPKDMYADRPLPYIIGSQPWKNKWHAGLILEDSDSDSSASKVDHDSEQYSQSEPEDTTDKLRVPDTHTTVSETSSELPSEQGSVPKPSASDVASEIARRLGAGEPPKIAEKEPIYEQPSKPTVQKIYRPQDPVSSTIFSDEPPPLSDQSDSAESDIFAELHRAQAQVGAELFGEREDSDGGDIFSDFAQKPTNPSAKPTSIFDAGPTPHMFDKLHQNQRSDDYHNQRHDHHNQRHDHHRTQNDDRTRSVNDDQKDVVDEPDRGVKKPVGGISLFGNKGTESIGAAILKRNQRKSSTSGDDSGSDSRSESQPSQQIRKEKDIFDDLFARSEGKKITKDKVNVVKDIKTEIQKKNEIKDKNIEKPKVDLFSDNLFDDIDDIFSTNVVKMPVKDNSNSKSIFEDDDDLFSEIAAPKPMKIEVASSSSNKKSLFDSDDELFAENVNPPENKPIVMSKPKPEAAKKSIYEPPNASKDKTKSIFDDDDDELFGDVNTKANEVSKVQSNTPVNIEKTNDLSKSNENVKNIAPPKSSANVFKSPSLFDDDDDDDDSDIFAESTKSSNIQSITAASSKDNEKLSSKTEDTISKENVKVDVLPSSSVKIDEFTENIIKNKAVSLDKNSKPTENQVSDIVNDIEVTRSLEDEKNSVLPVRESVDRNNSISKENIANAVLDHIHEKVPNIEQSTSNTNDDFSDQDFDDPVPEEIKTNKNLFSNSNVATEIKNNEIPTNTHNIFDKTTLEEDIDKIFAKPENIDNTDTIFENTDTDFIETLPKDTEKTEKDNKTDQFATKSIETDIFSDILTEPPVFEKPKEPKRSKNVNALFDDDSDDESLFFKKNDPIFEENPKDFTPTQDRIFGLFTDEPPDDDFGKISDDLDNDMFCTLPKPKLPQNDKLPPDVDFEESIPVSKIPEIEKNNQQKEIFNDEIKPVLEKETILETDKLSNKDIFKVPTEENIDKSMQEHLSPKILSDDDQLFKIPTNNVKPSLKDKPSPDILSDDENLFSSVPILEKPSLLSKPKKDIPGDKNLESSTKSSDDELFTSLTKNEPSVPENKVEKQDSISDEDLFKAPKSKTEFIPKSAEKVTPEKSDTKKVGKLKVGLNINVNALLPGASPKKVKPTDNTDGQTKNVAESQNPESKMVTESQKPEIKLPESQNADSKLLKSVSFDGKPESDVLDNKLSKERAKIQVKRRPSTRRARREAVRKSAIDFGEDSTDNSSSIDEPPRISTGKQPETSQKTNTEDTKQDVVNPVDNIDKTVILAKPVKIISQTENQPKPVEKETTIQPENKEIEPKNEKPRDVKSKLVYILNDEDIFNTSPVEKQSGNLDSNTGVTTLGKVYDKPSINKTKNDPTTSLFGDENDDEIFQGKTAVKKTNILDFDSDEELFGTSKKENKKQPEIVEVKKEIKREVMKGSLFGDDDDDDDLFGVKTKKSVEQKPQSSRSVPRENPKPTEPVFEDPLSMFGDDD